jgi:tetratricopeptide (TPR) repeat protein
VGLIAVALWAIVPSYQQQEARQKKIAAATNLVEKGELEKAIKRFALLETKFPNEREVFLGLAKAYAQKEDFTNATRYAELYADWKPKPPETRTTREKLSQRFMNLFETSTPSFNHTEAHEYILTQGKQGDQPSDLHRNLALRTLAINPDSLPAITLLIKESILRNKAEEAISYAERAVKLDPHGLNRHLELARACQMKQDWARVITECDAELATHPSNESATELRKMAVNAGGTLPQQPVPAPPAATPAAESN